MAKAKTRAKGTKRKSRRRKRPLPQGGRLIQANIAGGLSNEDLARRFSYDVQAKIADLTVTQIHTLQRTLAFDFVAAVVPNTPVDTGRAKGGWQVEIGPYPVGGPTPLDKNGQATLDAAAAKLAEYGNAVEERAKALPPERATEALAVVWVSNNVPYIEVLDRGYKEEKKTGRIIPWSKRGSGFFKKGIDFLRSRLV